MFRRVAESENGSLRQELERLDHVGHFLLVHRRHAAERTGHQRRLGAVFGHFEAVESFEHALAGRNYRLLADTHDRIARRQGLEQVRGVLRGRRERKFRHFAQHDVALGNHPGIELGIRDAVGREAGRIRNDRRIQLRLRVEERLDEPRGRGQRLAGFILRALDQHHVGRFEGGAVGARRGDQEGIRAEPDRDGAVGAGEQELVVGAARHLRHFAALFEFIAARALRGELRKLLVAVGEEVGQLIRRNRLRLAEGHRVGEHPGAEVERFDAAERLVHRPAHHACAVVAQQRGVVPLREFGADQFAEAVAAGNVIARETDAAADSGGGAGRAGVRRHAGDAEADQRRGMGVQHRLHVRTELVDGAVERVFDRRAVGADDGAVGLHAHDILAAQRAFVDAAGADPHIPVAVHDREVAAAGGGHPVIVDALHERDDLVAGMDELVFRHSCSL